jgi:hypothetical protein
MERHGTALAAAEIRVAASGTAMRGHIHRLQHRQSTAAQVVLGAFAVGVLVGFVVARRMGLGTLGGLIVSELARRGVKHLVAKADRSV